MGDGALRRPRPRHATRLPPAQPSTVLKTGRRPGPPGTMPGKPWRADFSVSSPPGKMLTPRRASSPPLAQKRPACKHAAPGWGATRDGEINERQPALCVSCGCEAAAGRRPHRWGGAGRAALWRAEGQRLFRLPGLHSGFHRFLFGWRYSWGRKKRHPCTDGPTEDRSERRSGKGSDAGPLLATHHGGWGWGGAWGAGAGAQGGRHSPLTRLYLWARSAACRLFPLPVGPQSSTLGVKGALERWLVWT